MEQMTNEEYYGLLCRAHDLFKEQQRLAGRAMSQIQTRFPSGSDTVAEVDLAKVRGIQATMSVIGSELYTILQKLQ